ncbi:MAG: nucleoid-associated protein, partial [Defluviitaleaceae bacterium]|nr:nucleoid-associated protein [Defluviitaleaceae bacterium]
RDDSDVYRLLTQLKSGEVFFRDAGIAIGQALADIVRANDDIPAGDALITLFEMNKSKYIAVLKLNYQECFTHEATNRASGMDNRLVKQLTVLPFGSGKVGEACLIPLDPTPYNLRVIEEPFVVDGEARNYFSEMFLKCEPQISRKEAARILAETSEGVVEKYYNGSVEALVRVKATLIAEAEESEGNVSLPSVAAKAFDSGEARAEFIALAKEAGLRPEVFLGEKFARQQFGTQKIKAENGLEIKLPVELMEDGASVEIRKGAEGTEIVLRHLGNLETK